MKLLLAVLLTASGVASADPIPARERVYSNSRLPGGTGFDKQIVHLHGVQADFDNGVYFLRIDVHQKKLTNYRLPSVTFTNYCGHFRTNGGSIGDYKPKSISRLMTVRNETTDTQLPLWNLGNPGQDYNQTPIESRIGEFHPRGTRIDIPTDSPLMRLLLQKCKYMRPYPYARITWETTHSCRWKPEIWHKPNLWKDEYLVPITSTMISKSVFLHCVNF